MTTQREIDSAQMAEKQALSMHRGVHTKTVSQEDGLAVARGKVFGSRGIYKYGRNPACPTTDEDIWDGSSVYAGWLTAAETMDVASTDAGDSSTGAGGAGARTIRVHGLDSNWDEVYEDVSLLGAVAVETTQEFLRVNRAYVLTDGGTNNIGAISVASSTGGVLCAQITALMGQTLMALYTVPRRYTAHLRQADATMGATGKTCEARLFTRTFGGSWRVQQTPEIVGGKHPKDFVYYPGIPAKTDIRWNANMGAGETNVISADFTLILDQDGV